MSGKKNEVTRLLMLPLDHCQVNFNNFRLFHSVIITLKSQIVCSIYIRVDQVQWISKFSIKIKEKLLEFRIEMRNITAMIDKLLLH
jgi:hypothetical protein